MMDPLPPHTLEGSTPFTTIPLTQGYQAIVDLEDADLAQLKWYITCGRYAMRRPRIPGSRTERLVILIHRVILERELGRPIQPGMVVDHVNGNGLDNRRVNLREVTISLNAYNRDSNRKHPAPTKPSAVPAYTIDESDPDTAIIPVNKGKQVLVDVVDVDLARFKWAVSSGRYAMHRIEKQGTYQRLLMHRIVLERKLERPITPGMIVDHVNGDGLDNRRENLREATQAQNMRNTRLRSNNTSSYKGVRRINAHTWEARVNNQAVGYFDTAEDASFAYDRTALEQYGEFAHLNHSLEQVRAWVSPIRQPGRGTSGYRGVQPCGKRWTAEIKHHKRRIQLGFFDTAEEAAFAYDKAALEIHGEKACLNHRVEQVLTWNAPARQLRMTNTSGYRGVKQIGKRWSAAIHTRGRRTHLGMFDNPEEAARAYDKAALEAYGESAILNFAKKEYQNG